MFNSNTVTAAEERSLNPCSSC